MNFVITINGEGAEFAQALRALKAVADSTDGYEITTGTVQATVEEKPKKNSRSKLDPEPMKAAEADPVASENETEAELDLEDDAPVPTAVELRAMAQKVGTNADKKKAIKALLDTYESKSISDVPEEKRAAFLADLSGI